MLKAIGKFDVAYYKAMAASNSARANSILGKALEELYDTISQSDLTWEERNADLEIVKKCFHLCKDIAKLMEKFYDLKAKKASENEIDDIKAECYAKLYEARPVCEKLNVIRERLITVGVEAKAKA